MSKKFQLVVDIEFETEEDAEYRIDDLADQLIEAAHREASREGANVQCTLKEFPGQ